MRFAFWSRAVLLLFSLSEPGWMSLQNKQTTSNRVVCRASGYPHPKQFVPPT